MEPFFWAPFHSPFTAIVLYCKVVPRTPNGTRNNGRWCILHQGIIIDTDSDIGMTMVRIQFGEGQEGRIFNI